MNKFIQNFFQVVYPFYPLWAFVATTFLHFPIEKIFIFVLLPMLLYIIWAIRIMVPAYLVFFISFTLYHIISTFYFGLLPGNTTPFRFIFSDQNVLACILLLIIENTNFDEVFLKRMNRHILIIVGLSLIVSVIQIKNPMFFYDRGQDSELNYAEEARNPSIYSWVGLNSIGVTFPILIAILLNYYNTASRFFPLVTISGIVVAFLTKARFVMVSTIVAFLQLLLIRSVPLKRKIYIISFFVGGIFLIIGAAQMAGYNINNTINERILEKDTDMRSAKARMVSYDVFMVKFPENPYFGVGPKTRNDVVDLLDGSAPIIHVGYLSYLYYYGAFGASLLFLALLCMLWDAWMTGRRNDFWGSFYGLLGFTLANFTFVYFNFSEMGIILAIIYMRYYKVNPTNVEDHKIKKMQHVNYKMA